MLRIWSRMRRAGSIPSVGKVTSCSPTAARCTSVRSAPTTPGTRALPRAPVAGEHLLPVLLAPAPTAQPPRSSGSPTSTTSIGWRSSAIIGDDLVGDRPLRPATARGATPRSRSSSTTNTTAAASPRCCSSTSPSPRRRPGSPASPHRCCRRTDACSACSSRPASRCDSRFEDGRGRGASWPSSPRPRPRRPSKNGRRWPKPGRSSASCGRARSRSSAHRETPARSAMRCSATSRPRLQRARVPSQPRGGTRGERACLAVACSTSRPRSTWQ